MGRGYSFQGFKEDAAGGFIRGPFMRCRLPGKAKKASVPRQDRDCCQVALWRDFCENRCKADLQHYPAIRCADAVALVAISP
jgi:hypothetical protein